MLTKKYMWLTLLVFPVAAIAQAVNEQVPVDEVLKALLGLIGGVKGGSVLAVSALSIQLLMKVMGSSLADFAGKWKLLIVCVLSLASQVVAVLMNGGSVMGAILNGAVLAAAQVLGHQVYVQFIQKEPAAPELKS